MAVQGDVNSLLRFLSQDAKLSLSTAIKVVKPLQAASLSTHQQISSSSIATLTPIFPSVDEAKKVLNAAKRLSKRYESDDIVSSPRKKRRLSPTVELSPEDEAVKLEASLALPALVMDTETLESTLFVINRAPLMLAFTLTLLEYTMPRQPLSSRLSLAQAVVSEGALAKAKHLGIDKGPTPEDEGWGIGQPTVTVMGRDVKVIRRVDYPLAKAQSNDGVKDMASEERVEKGSVEGQDDGLKSDAIEENSKLPNERQHSQEGQERDQQDEEVAYWALDLGALKKSNTNVPSNTNRISSTGLPIYSPHSARSYLINTFASASTTSQTSPTEENPIRPANSRKGKGGAAKKDENVGLVLGALKLLFESWRTLPSSELARRAWSWYVAVRPDIRTGPSGWGQKGELRLQRILDLRKPST